MDIGDVRRMAALKGVMTGAERPCASKFGLYLRNERHRRGMTYREFISYLGIITTQLSNWERGVSHPGEEVLRRIAPLLDISYNELADKVVESKEYKIEAGDDGIEELFKLQKRGYSRSSMLQKLKSDPGYRGCGKRAESQGPKRNFVCSILLPIDVARWYAALAEREDRALSKILSIRLLKYYEEQTGLTSTD